MLQRLRERGVRVPEDMSIVGCDDIFGEDFYNLPTRRLAVMPTHLTIRGSTGPARIP
jgi:LacI family transcriptional regulator